MAPKQKTVEQQTSEIIRLLVEDDFPVFRCSEVETDGPPGEDEFDAGLIAGKMISIADSLHDSVVFRQALSEFKKEVAKEALEAAFSNTVERVCQVQAHQCPGLTAELQLLQATVVFTRLVAKSCPNLRNDIMASANAFINRSLGSWINQQGGWTRIDI